MAKSKAGRDGYGNAYFRFWCVGCNESHSVPVNGQGRPQWTFNGDYEKPTLSPSIKITSGHFVDGWTKQRGCWCNEPPDGEEWGFSCGICHLFVEDGVLKYCSDSTHALAGQNVPMVDLPDGED